MGGGVGAESVGPVAVESAGAEARSAGAVNGAGDAGEPEVEPGVEPEVEPEGSVLPHAWQLVCPRKTSVAPQNWQVGLPAPCPSVKLTLSSGSVQTQAFAARQYDLAHRAKDRPARCPERGP
jgi:hypothetical protein